jgi:predicted RNA-binding protein with RPS1 domain
MKIGDTVIGEITAIMPYGAFVKLDNQLVGLIHISEFSDQFVRSIEDYVAEGEQVKLKVLDIVDEKVSLSFKAVNKRRKKRIRIVLSIGFKTLKDELIKMIEDYHKK